MAPKNVKELLYRLLKEQYVQVQVCSGCVFPDLFLMGNLFCFVFRFIYFVFSAILISDSA